MEQATRTFAVESEHANTDAYFDHVILTRFNLPSQGAEGLLRSRASWLSDRAKLFERYCVPSVRGQLQATAHWLVFLDPQSPPWLKDLMAAYHEERILSPVYTESLSQTDLICNIRSAVGKTTKTLVTTNLDNDDALSCDFLLRVADSVRANETYALYFARGVIRADHYLYLRRDNLNAFCTVVCPWAAPITCWADWHNHLPKTMPATVLGGSRAWMQVVHGANVSNRVRGRLTQPRPLYGRFPATCVDSIASPTPARIAVDWALLYPVRSARDSLRTLARMLLLAVGGKDSIDRVRFWAKRFSLRCLGPKHSAADRAPKR